MKNSVINDEPIVVPSARAAVLEQASISWRAIFAGTAVAFLVDLVLMSLGLAIGGVALKGIVQGGGGGQGLGVGSAIWTIVSVLISLFVGSYVSGRVSGVIPSRIGRVQGAVICALFFGFMFSQVGAALGFLGTGIGSTVSSVGEAAGSASQNPQVQQVIQTALGGLNLKSPPSVVAQGIATRIVQGDTNGARDYLADQAGITPAEADQRIQTFRAQVQTTFERVASGAARAISIAGWTLFLASLLGTGASVLGGDFGARTNLRRGVTEGDLRALDQGRGRRAA